MADKDKEVKDLTTTADGIQAQAEKLRRDAAANGKLADLMSSLGADGVAKDLKAKAAAELTVANAQQGVSNAVRGERDRIDHFDDKQYDQYKTYRSLHNDADRESKLSTNMEAQAEKERQGADGARAAGDRDLAKSREKSARDLDKSSNDAGERAHEAEAKSQMYDGAWGDGKPKTTDDKALNQYYQHLGEYRKMARDGATNTQLYKKLGELQREGEAIRGATYDGPNKGLYDRAQVDVGKVASHAETLAKTEPENVGDVARRQAADEKSFPQALDPEQSRNLTRGVVAAGRADQQPGRTGQQHAGIAL